MSLKLTYLTRLALILLLTFFVAFTTSYFLYQKIQSNSTSKTSTDMLSNTHINKPFFIKKETRDESEGRYWIWSKIQGYQIKNDIVYLNVNLLNNVQKNYQLYLGKKNDIFGLATVKDDSYLEYPDPFSYENWSVETVENFISKDIDNNIFVFLIHTKVPVFNDCGTDCNKYLIRLKELVNNNASLVNLSNIEKNKKIVIGPITQALLFPSL